jgi:tRNA A-37 threonylcarbamoyl transferase component Bud32
MPLDPDILTAPPAEVYKSDRRSRVWRVDLPPERGGRAVIKRFEYSPLRQAVAWRLGIHPAQRELRAAARLRSLGLPVAEIMGAGTERSGWGIRAWVATRWLGRSLHNRLRDGDLDDFARRTAAAEAVGRLTAGLLSEGLVNRDHKASNLILDDAGRVWLIDAGAVRRAEALGAHVAAAVMLTGLDRSTPPPLASRTDRLRVVRALGSACPRLTDVKALVKSVRLGLIQ